MFAAVAWPARLTHAEEKSPEAGGFAPPLEQNQSQSVPPLLILTDT
jgi:hypothetical protein